MAGTFHLDPRLWRISGVSIFFTNKTVRLSNNPLGRCCMTNGISLNLLPSNRNVIFLKLEKAALRQLLLTHQIRHVSFSVSEGGKLNFFLEMAPALNKRTIGYVPVGSSQRRICGYSLQAYWPSLISQLTPILSPEKFCSPRWISRRGLSGAVL